MKVNPNSHIPQMMEAYRKNRPGTAKTAGDVNAVQDKIELSEKAKEFQVAMKAYQKLPEIRQEYVEDAKAKIREGRLATPEQVAEKMMLEASNRRSRF